MKKKIFVFFATVMLAVVAFSFQSSAFSMHRPYKADENTKIIDHIVYRKLGNNEYYSIIDWFDTEEAVKTTTEINIVEEIDGIPVKEIYIPGYWDTQNFDFSDSNTAVKEIHIPPSITHFEYGSFSAFDGIKTMVIPETVESVASAFLYMDSLESVTINSDTKHLGSFRGCKNLKEIKLNGEIEYITDHAFRDCISLKSIPTSQPVEIGQGAFVNSGIESITLKASAIDGFTDCKALEKVVINCDSEDDDISLRINCFRGSGIKKLYITGKVPQKIYVNSYAFKDCDRFTDIYFCGSPEKWKEVLRVFSEHGNESFNEAEIHYYYDHIHDFELTVQEATCKKTGTKTYSCFCGDTDKVTIPKTGHSFGEWKVTKKPTKKANGTAKRTCTGCNKSETKAVVYGYTPGVTSKIAASVAKRSVKLSWKAVEGATGYRVYRYNYETGKHKKIKDVEGTTLTHKDLTPGIRYRYAVKAYTKIGSKTYFAKNYKTLVVATTPKAPTLRAGTGVKGDKLLRFDGNNFHPDNIGKASNNYGFVIYRSTSKNGKYEKIATIKRTDTSVYKTKVLVGKGVGESNLYKDKSIKAGKTYYYKMRAVVAAGGKNYYSSYSNIVAIKK